jgi:hypothetical protein
MGGRKWYHKRKGTVTAWRQRRLVHWLGVGHSQCKGGKKWHRQREQDIMVCGQASSKYEYVRQSWMCTCGRFRMLGLFLRTSLCSNASIALL